MIDKKDELFEFPCEFNIKAMGTKTETFADTICALVAKYADFDHNKDINTRESKNSKYLSVTITITAESRTQLDKIYQALTDCKDVLMSF